ncbi:hypothetical protein AVENLUH8758_02076 [Acinetobacter venetianus]|nr:hypothetical protein AVENLUH8758_02076 [Acinetobacter venetianus]
MKSIIFIFKEYNFNVSNKIQVSAADFGYLGEKDA